MKRWLLLCLLCVHGAWANAPAQALVQNPSHDIVIADDSKPVADFKQQFQAQLMSEAYSDTRTVKRWEKNQIQEQGTAGGGEGFWTLLVNWLRLRFLLDETASVLSVLFKTILLFLLAVFVIWLYKKRAILSLAVQKYRNHHHATIMPEFIQDDDNDPLPSGTLMMDKIKQHISTGDYVKALSYLYRGSLQAMKLSYQLPINKSQTEQQCQALLWQARQQYPDELDFFDELVSLWQKVAYGQQLPDDIAKRLPNLLITWQRLYADTDTDIRGQA